MQPIQVINNKVRVRLPGNTARKDRADLLRGGIMFAFKVIADDIADKLSEEAAARCAAQYLDSFKIEIDKPRRRYRRLLKDSGQYDNYLRLESSLCDIANRADANIAQARAVCRDAMVQRLKFQYVTVGELLAVLGGCIKIMRRCYFHIYGRESSDFKEADYYLELFEERVGIQSLNGESAAPDDFTEGSEAIIGMLAKVTAAVVDMMNKDNMTQ